MFNPNCPDNTKMEQWKKTKIWDGQSVKKCITLGLKDEKEFESDTP